jgi:hypothetical protein
MNGKYKKNCNQIVHEICGIKKGAEECLIKSIEEKEFILERTLLNGNVGLWLTFLCKRKWAEAVKRAFLADDNRTLDSLSCSNNRRCQEK